METFLIRVLQLILSLSLLVIIHEGGHFVAAKIFKVRVEKFYIFFAPWFALFRWKPKRSETEYGVGWLPLGGYVKIAGMIDESMDTEQMKKDPQPWEFRSKPAWQRLIIMVAGVVMNFLLALFIYSMILFHWGDSYISLQDMTNGMKFNETAQKIGFQDGDVLLSADGKQLQRFDINMYRAIADAREVTVLRHVQKKIILMPEVSLLEMAKENPPFIDVLIPNEIDSVLPNHAFANAGIQKGDKILAVNSQSVNSWNTFLQIMDDLKADALAKNEKTATLSVVYGRNGVQDTVTCQTDTAFMVGTIAKKIDYRFTNLKYSFFESFPAGIKLGVNTLKGYVDDMKYVFTKEGAKSLGGFGTIGSIFPKQWDWHKFWSMTAFLSIILAFMNILPIPALDGGHVLFLFYEIIARRKPSDKFMEYAQITGMFILFALLIWANFNDVLRFLF